MNLFESEYLQIALLVALITTLIVAAITASFEKFFEKEYRVKLLVLFSSIAAALITVDFDLTDWQKFVTKIVVTIAFAVLFYHYLGMKFIKLLFVKIKKMLPGNGDNDDDK